MELFHHHKERILITYATKCGSTNEIAEEIGKDLRKSGQEVDVFPINGIGNLEHYKGVVIGTGIRIGKIYPEVIDFVKKHKDQLKKVKVAYFLDCLTMSVVSEKSRAVAESYIKPLRLIVPPIAVGLFAGKVDFKKVPAIARLALKVMRVREGDYRKWDEIRRWAESLPKLLLGK